jgi:hypothetical protein
LISHIFYAAYAYCSDRCADPFFILTLTLFAFTIICMGFPCRYSAGFFRPDHDPPIALVG